MKQCPLCGREYDASMMFCLDDGTELLYGPASGGALSDEHRTAILREPSSHAEAATRTLVNATDQTAVYSTAPKTNAFDKRLLIAPVFLALIVVSGVAGYRYFVAAGSGTINSIAVLPFENKSSDPDTDYLSDGLAESLIFRLTQLPDLKVSPTSSVMRYHGQQTDVAKIASELGVDAVMTGRMMKRGDNLNITVELVDARNNKSLWGEQYERKMSDLLATQREIATVIVQKLQLKLTGDEKGVAKKYTNDNEAYQLWLKARFHFARRTKADMEKSIELFQQATQLDPNFALAWVGIAETYQTMPSFPYMAPTEAMPKARAAIDKALAIDPDLPEAHTVAGMIETTDGDDYAKAEQEYKRAIELGPNLAITHYRYGWVFLSAVGRHEEAIAEMKRAMELEPLSVQQGANYAAVLMYARRFDEAVEQARKAYELDPNHIGAQNWLCHALNASGRHDEAIVVGEKAQSTQREGVTSFRACLGVAYAKSGQREKSLALLQEVKKAGETQYISNYWLAIHYAALGDKQGAFSALETAFKNRDWFLRRLKVDPLMDPLRDDPRFDAMVKRLNFPE